MFQGAIAKFNSLALSFFLALLASTSVSAESGEDSAAWLDSLDMAMFEDSGFEDSSVEPCSSCDCENACEGSGSVLFGLIAKSDHSFDSFISPMTNPVFFEDPRTLTEARTIFLHHRLPNALGGGEVNLLAVQVRAALTERLSIIATKDGFKTSTSPLIEDGWADVSAGLKYNLYSNPCKQRLLSAGLTYEMPVGSYRALQGNGDGEFNLFMTGGTQFGDYCHWVSATGIRLPADRNEESTVMYSSNHFDYEFVEGWYALTEFNWYHWLDSGAGGVAGVEGIDLYNFGSTGVTGDNVVTQAVGFKYKRNKNRELGIAFEFPITQKKYVMENRLTIDWIIRY